MQQARLQTNSSLENFDREECPLAPGSFLRRSLLPAIASLANQTKSLWTTYTDFLTIRYSWAPPREAKFTNASERV